MADVTITNLTNEPVLLQELYVVLKPNDSITVVRERDQLHAMPALQQLWNDGKVDVSLVSDAAEDNFIDQIVHRTGGVPTTELTRTYHEPTITPDSGRGNQEPDLAILGSVLVANYTVGIDSAYRIFKIPNNFVGDAAFHVHWTKEEGINGDTDQSGNKVRWRVSYTVFEGENTDINTSPTVLDIDDTYDDAGTTTRITHRTANTPAAGFIANYYVGIKIEAVTPLDPALTCEPALISVDLTFTEYINK